MKAPNSQLLTSDDPTKLSAHLISCRVPVLFMLFCAVAWLLFGSVLGFMASLKFHAPTLWADSAWLTYGRLQPLRHAAFLYGFALPAAWAVSLWLLVRLGQTHLRAPWLVVFGIVLWNIGAKLGALGILVGDATGFEGIAFPRYAALILIVAYAMIGIPALLTFHGRTRRDLYVSQWFLLAAWFWFPWVYITAIALLILAPVRGVMQPLVDWWYLANTHQIALGFVGLAILFYAIPRFLNRPLHSRYLAMTAFWLLALFASWSGIPDSAPLPSWIPGVSTVFTVFFVVPLLAVGLNFHRTLEGHYAEARKPGLLAVAVFSLAAYLVTGLLTVAHALPAVHRFTQFTFFTQGMAFLFLYGFLAMAVFVGLYLATQDLIEGGLPSNRLVNVHLWCAAIGVLLIAVPLLLGGLLQGRALNDPNNAFMDTLRPGLMALRISTLGDVLLVVGHVALMFNFLLAGARFCLRLKEHVTPLLEAAAVEVRR
jgi:cytochrome c oxidase cbb3-type subunit 1